MNDSVANQNSKRLYFYVFILFFLSGISGLIYQIVWTRELVLIFGNTMLATSTVLSAFMAGLAAGSYAAGKYVDKRPRRLIRVYALLEAGIGVFALIFPLLLSAAGPVYSGLYKALGGNILILNFIRFFICFALIVVPTFLMGATLPVLLKRFVKSSRTIGRQMGLLYGLNTAGAVTGSLVCGFLFLRLIGMRLTVLFAVVINLLVALLAWLLGRGDADAKEAEQVLPGKEEKEEILPRPYGSLTVKMVLLGIGISGFCALAYEVFWTRMLNLFFHNTVYSFSTILATFLAGIAIGSLIYAKFLSRVTNKILFFVFIEIGIGILAYAAPFIFNLLYDPLFSRAAETLTVLKAAVIMIAPTILMGIALPLAVQICQRGPQREGDSVGTVYAVNTVGSILGAFAAGFLLLPNLGIHKSVIAVVALNIFAGLLVLVSTVRLKSRLIYIFSFALILIVSYVVAPTTLFRDLYQKKQPTAELMLYKEGKIANVVVYDFQKSGYKDLYLNGIEEASDRLWHVQLFKMLGVLPTVVHPQPDDALMIAFGAGMSAGACVNLVDYFECAELNPDIFEEAGLFKKENRDVINNPKLNMVFNDGRNHLLLTPKTYSLIISDATNPLTFDSWTLYTKEFYELCKQKLKPGGVFCQWVPIPLPGDAVKVILKTFKSVFPHTSLWTIYGSSQCLMLGTPERLHLDYRELTKKLPAVLENTGLVDYGVDTVDKFLSFFFLGEDELDEYLTGFDKINSDDLPDAQFHGGHNQEGIQTSLELLMYQGTIAPYLSGMGEEKDRLQAVLGHYSTISRMLNTGFLKKNDFEFQKALAYAAEVDPALAKDLNIICMLKYGPVRKEYFLKRVQQYPEDANTRNTLGFIYWRERDFQKAIAGLEQAVALKPDFANAYVNLAKAYIDASLFDRGVAILMKLREMCPAVNILNMVLTELRLVHNLRKLRYHKDEPDLYLNLGRAYLDRRALNRSIHFYKSALELRQDDLQALNSLAFLYETCELFGKSLKFYERLEKVTPAEKKEDTKGEQTNKEKIKEKIKELRAILTDPGARRDWIADKIKPEKPVETHPEGCKRALDLWSNYEFDGKIKPQKLRAAALEYEKVIEVDKKHMHAYADAANIYEHLGEYGKAADLWRAGLEVTPGNQLAVNNLRRLGLLIELERKPASQRRAQIYNDLGVLYWSNRHMERAIDCFEKALKDDPNFAMTYANLAANYIDTGKYPEAIQALEKALSLDPQINFAEKMKERLEWLKKLVNK